MFSETELKALNKLPQKLKERVINQDALFDKVKKSHDLPTYLALYAQKIALENEMQNDPFLIRGSSEMAINAEGVITESAVKDAIKEAITARQNVETVLKVAKTLPEINKALKSMYISMTDEEKEQAIEPTLENISNELKQRGK